MDTAAASGDRSIAFVNLENAIPGAADAFFVVVEEAERRAATRNGFPQGQDKGPVRCKMSLKIR